MATGAIGGVGGAGAGAGMGVGSLGSGRGALAAAGAPHLHVKPVHATPRVRSVDDLAILYLLLANQQSQSTANNTIMSLAVKPAAGSTGTNVDLMV